MGVRTHFRILWRNTATQEVTVQSAANSSESDMYYTFPVPTLSRGEYEYFIIADGGELEVKTNDIRRSTIDGEAVVIYDRGLAQVGEISANDTTYNIAKTYEQYTGEENAAE